MVMVAESVPGLKRWVATLGLKDSAKLLVIRLVVRFLLHAGRMSCLRAAGVLRCEAHHRAQISRLLGGSHTSLPSFPSVRGVFAPGRTSPEIPPTSLTSWKLNKSPSGTFSSFM
jgi:hypothetical protein